MKFGLTFTGMDEFLEDIEERRNEVKALYTCGDTLYDFDSLPEIFKEGERFRLRLDESEREFEEARAELEAEYYEKLLHPERKPYVVVLISQQAYKGPGDFRTSFKEDCWDTIVEDAKLIDEKNLPSLTVVPPNASLKRILRKYWGKKVDLMEIICHINPIHGLYDIGKSPGDTGLGPSEILGCIKVNKIEVTELSIRACEGIVSAEEWTKEAESYENIRCVNATDYGKAVADWRVPAGTILGGQGEEVYKNVTETLKSNPEAEEIFEKLYPIRWRIVVF
jgi:hypothetical protein